ncbi:MAG: DNA-processing protein DprA [Gammaproteobacteria bacterium]|nr:DNA-processing protein DprA [Gammaproteobacteria bacterium]
MSELHQAYLYFHLLTGIPLKLKKQLLIAFDGVVGLEAQTDQVLQKYLTQAQVKLFRERHATLERQVQYQIHCMARDQVTLLCFEDKDYPACLRVLPDPPIALFVKGDVSSLHRVGLAMVGARNSQVHSEELAYRYAQYVAQQGLCVVSGLARGIDVKSHQGALATGIQGASIAVMGTGFDRLYPKENIPWAKHLMKQGLVLTEQAYGVAFHRAHFPRRNRLIAGLSVGVLLVEARRKSGSLITAQYALDIDREIMAMPGSCFLQSHQGCHDLIKEGAVLVDSPQDVMDVLVKACSTSSFEREQRWYLQYQQGLVGGVTSQTNCVPDIDLRQFDPDLVELVSCLLTGLFSLDELAYRLNKKSEDVYLQLFELEMKRLIRQDELGRYFWCPEVGSFD